MKLLLHCCCGPCSIMPMQILQEEGIEITGFFYNPNIHPYKEYQLRRDTYLTYAASQKVSVILKDDYDLDSFLSKVALRVDDRCPVCYEMRLSEAAKTAQANGFDAFATTLAISPYQNHELLQQVGQKMSEQFGIPYFYRDFRPYFREAQNKAKELGLYRQGYCGCIYSERDRYEKKKKGEKKNAT